MSLESIRYSDGKLEILDQLLLPTETKYIPIKNVEEGWDAIRLMKVRGAPAIAIVGCLSLAVELPSLEYSCKTKLREMVMNKLSYLVSARPTAVNMKLAADSLTSLSEQLEKDNTVSVEEMKAKLVKTVVEMLEKDLMDNRAIGKFGSEAILAAAADSGKVQILTHCNTGSLATAGYGTALGVIRALHKQDKLEHVYCTETRPYNQGARLTAYELVHEKMPATLVCDSAVAALMNSTKISAVVVGADRVAANGDTANKIGTYQIAVTAKYHNVPFYIAAPFTSIDKNLPTGKEIVIEERPEKEMTHVANIRIAAPDISCWNPAFDVTPAELITGIITEQGVFPPHKLC